MNNKTNIFHALMPLAPFNHQPNGYIVNTNLGKSFPSF
jgi:hypothetical protein